MSTGTRLALESLVLVSKARRCTARRAIIPIRMVLTFYLMSHLLSRGLTSRAVSGWRPGGEENLMIFRLEFWLFFRAFRAFFKNFSNLWMQKCGVRVYGRT